MLPGRSPEPEWQGHRRPPRTRVPQERGSPHSTEVRDGAGPSGTAEAMVGRRGPQWVTRVGFRLGTRPSPIALDGSGMLCRICARKEGRKEGKVCGRSFED